MVYELLSNLRDITISFVALIGGFIIGYILIRTVFPIIVEKTTKVVEKNPKWITPKIREKYYGLSDIDIVTVKSPIGSLPRFHLEKKQNRLELLIPEDLSVNAIDEIARLALIRKNSYILWVILSR